MTTALAERPPSPEALGVVAQQFALARARFATFLRFVLIERRTDAGMPDPDVPDAIGFERWPYLLERAEAWQAGENEIVLKARQLGFTWLAAAYAVWVASYRPGSGVMVISMGEREAMAFIERCKFVLERLPAGLAPMKWNANAGQIKVIRGGMIQALPSTANAGRSSTTTVFIVDEAAFHPWGAKNYQAYRPTVADGGQLIMMSTSAGKGGFFYDRYQRARQGLADDVTWRGKGKQFTLRPVFVPWWERPGRDQEWYDRERADYEGIGARFAEEYPATETEAFAALTGLVYPEFDPAVHVRAEHPVPWESCLFRIGGYDLGGGDPTAAIVLGVYRDPETGKLAYHQYGERWWQMGAITVEEIDAYWQQWKALAPFTRIIPDPAPGGAVVAASLARLGWPMGERPTASRQDGLELVSMLLARKALTIHASCVQGIREFGEYRWLNRTDPASKDRFATSTPFDHHGDVMDARRMALVALRKILVEPTAPPRGKIPMRIR